LGKRLFRITPAELLQQKETLLGHELQVILHNSTVFLGRLMQVDATQVQCKNAIGKPFQFAASDIKEIIYDKQSSH
jgi:hypothetical protein